MKYKLLYAVLLLSISQFSCKDNSTEPAQEESVYPALPAMTIQWGDTNSIVCFGTSLTYGCCGGSSQCAGNQTYPRFLQDNLKIKVYNQGYIGATINYEGRLFLDDSVLSKKPVLVLLEFSANECLGGYPAHDADTLLSALIQRIIADSVKVVLLSFIHPEMIDLARKIFWTQEEADLAYEYWYMLNSMAARYSLPFINYPLKGIYGNLNLMSYDMIHPNGAGYNKMATNVYQALIETFRTNGMLK